VSQHISRLERELDMPHFEQRAVLENALMLLALHDDPLAAQARVSLADLQLLRYISLPAFTLTATHIRHHAAQAGVTLHPTARVDDYDTAYVFVQLGLGHAIVPAMQGDHFQQEGGVRTMPIEGLPPLQVGWAARQFRLLSPAAHDFMAIFATLADQWRDRPGFTVL
jgi:DNA-binding transcriptional LysR family regulator